ncbi:MAG TPA: RsmE family RNA methyltransferase, partial [Candidatus Cybelea sp.]|nr:RsmE family RNA methyltransferase [Candidatus Cybelea sp.]
MRRFYLPPPECVFDHIALTGSEAHHAADVLRVKVGDHVAVLDGAGSELHCRVESATRKKVQLEVQQRDTAQAPPWRITLVQAIPKGKMMEAIIQKATELGVWRIVPLLSQRVTTHLEGDSIDHKAEKWRQTA